jgi:hypothetical protein
MFAWLPSIGVRFWREADRDVGMDTGISRPRPVRDMTTLWSIPRQVPLSCFVFERL